MITKHRASIIAGAAILLAGAAAGFNVFSHNPFWEAIENSIASGKGRVRFQEVTPFEWDTVCILPPYTVGIKKRQNQASELLPPDVRYNANDLPEIDADGGWLFAFISKDSLVRFERRGRGHGLKLDAPTNCLSSASAGLQPETAPAGFTYLSITN